MLVSSTVNQYVRIDMLYGKLLMNLVTTKEANKKSDRSQDAQLPFQWHPPLASIFKINFDTAHFKDIFCCGVGVVIQDHLGKFIAGATEKIDNILSPELAEVLATRGAVKLATELGLSEFWLETLMRLICLTLILAPL
ncbi:hypothetical protein ACH5RR_034528 [Cinchona calisaya]|uniref:RNase H type-1 domain-containing protein n=1 Tax=Cinchona calisaya TaxID=153742 RepID=A0ABD2YB68_9GENT